MGFADPLELRPRALGIEFSELKSLSLPVILHWSFNHFVVLKAVTREKVIVHDSVVVIRKYSLEEVEQRFTGIALELNPRSNFSVSDKNLDFLSLLIQAFAPTTQFYMQLVVDEDLDKHDADLLLVLGIGFLN